MPDKDSASLKVRFLQKEKHDDDDDDDDDDGDGDDDYDDDDDDNNDDDDHDDGDDDDDDNDVVYDFCQLSKQMQESHPGSPCHTSLCSFTRRWILKMLSQATCCKMMYIKFEFQWQFVLLVEHVWRCMHV